QLDHVLVIKVRARDVNKLSRLLLNCSYNFRVAVPGRAHRNSGGEIKELVAVYIFDNAAAAALSHHRIRARVRRRNEFVIELQDAGGVRAWQLGLDLRAGGGAIRNSFRGHDSAPCVPLCPLWLT